MEEPILEKSTVESEGDNHIAEELDPELAEEDAGASNVAVEAHGQPIQTNMDETEDSEPKVAHTDGEDEAQAPSDAELEKTNLVQEEETIQQEVNTDDLLVDPSSPDSTNEEIPHDGIGHAVEEPILDKSTVESEGDNRIAEDAELELAKEDTAAGNVQATTATAEEDAEPIAGIEGDLYDTERQESLQIRPVGAIPDRPLGFILGKSFQKRPNLTESPYLKWGLKIVESRSERRDVQQVFDLWDTKQWLESQNSGNKKEAELAATTIVRDAFQRNGVKFL